MADVKKRRDLSLSEKINILEKYDKLPKLSQRNAAAQLKISQPILCKILKKRVEIEDAAKKNENLLTKRNRTGKDAQVESALKLWFANVREQDARVDGPLMRQKAEELANKMGKENFVATEGWFHRWKKRENIVYKRTHGEQKDADFKSAEHWIENEWTKIAGEFTPNDIFNADETGLYYRALPDHTYMFKKDNAKGCKTSKERITILCCANMSGDKEKLLVIGKSKNPRCFKSVKNLPVDYYSNTNAWMTSLIFNDWLLKWDKRLNRKIALLVDNCAAHCVNCQLKNIKVIFLPANTTSIIQPCDQGIIRTMKAYYRKEMRARILESMEDTLNMSANDLAKKTNLLDALHLITMSWSQVSKITIKNCFKHGGFSKDDIEPEHRNIQPPDMTTSEFEEWMAIDNELNVAQNVTEEEICESLMCKSVTTSSIENQEPEEEVDIQTMQPPTMSEMRKALEVLRRGVQHRSSDFQTHYDYEIFVNNLLRENQRQTTLDEFF